jgi:hypothetical protein
MFKTLNTPFSQNCCFKNIVVIFQNGVFMHQNLHSKGLFMESNSVLSMSISVL